jgi:hypothetical protein
MGRAVGKSCDQDVYRDRQTANEHFRESRPRSVWMACPVEHEMLKNGQRKGRQRLPWPPQRTRRNCGRRNTIVITALDDLRKSRYGSFSFLTCSDKSRQPDRSLTTKAFFEVSRFLAIWCEHTRQLCLPTIAPTSLACSLKKQVIGARCDLDQILQNRSIKSCRTSFPGFRICSGSSSMSSW